MSRLLLLAALLLQLTPQIHWKSEVKESPDGQQIVLTGDLDEGIDHVTGTVTYMPCKGDACYMPVDWDFDLYISKATEAAGEGRIGLGNVSLRETPPTAESGGSLPLTKPRVATVSRADTPSAGDSNNSLWALIRPTHTRRRGLPSMSLSPLPVPAASLDGTASLLRAGGLAACPTETYFAVACDARNACAVDRVYQAKGRLATKPLPLVCADKDMVLAVTDLDLGAGKEQLHPAFFAFWPGPLTLVLKARAGFFNPKLVDARGKIALRVTPHPAARALAQTLGGPITATSANLQGRPPARLAGELDPDLLARLDCVFDAGPEPQGGLPSTIVEPLGGLKARILREGAVPACALAKQGIALA